MKGKNALITGSTRGIGKAIALRLASEGANIIIHGTTNSQERSVGILEEIKSKGVDAHFIACDVASLDETKELAKKAKELVGEVHILVNNAGITADRSFKKMEKSDWDKVMSINLDSLYNVTHEILPLMPEGARIINISSIVGLTGNFGQTNYAATKAGAIGFTKALAKEVGKKKITVNAICPGFIKTEMTEHLPVEMLAGVLKLTPLGVMGEVEDIAAAVAFLASDDAKFITATVMRVDGGLNI